MGIKVLGGGIEMIRISLALFLGVLLLGGYAVAQTPDGETPAVEDVCDGFEGAAYSLCNAYCEAMDCDSEEPQASDMACEKVLANFIKKTDEEPPCLGCCALNTCECQ